MYDRSNKAKNGKDKRNPYEGVAGISLGAIYSADRCLRYVGGFDE